MNVSAEDKDAFSGPGFYGAPATSKDIVAITIAGSHFKIPRNYLVSLIMIHNKVGFTMFTAFPDFHGATETTSDKFSQNPWIHKDIIIIDTITYDFSGNAIWKKERVQKAKDQKNSKDSRGLVAIEDNKMGINFVKLAKDKKDRDIVVNCSKHEASILPATIRCTGYIEFIPNLSFQYEFDQALLPQLKDVDQGVRNLVKSFLVEESK